jgi:predicted component of type VI protein secretion system
MRLVELQPLPGRRIEVRDGATVGRHDCDIIIDHPQVSRRHAILHVRDGALVIEDAGSRNGTFVNDERVDAPRELAEGDLVRIGETVWRVEAAGATEIAAVPGTAAAPGVTVAESPPPAPRGDVPAPPSPSVIEPALAPASHASPTFPEPAPRRQRRRRASAARRLEATLISYAVVAATAAGVIAYLASR